MGMGGMTGRLRIVQSARFRKEQVQAITMVGAAESRIGYRQFLCMEVRWWERNT